MLLLQAQGYDCTLFDVRGTNSRWAEYEYCTALAAGLGCPLQAVKWSLKGKRGTDIIENPINNHVILAQMVEWGVPQGFGTYCFGSAGRIGFDINPDSCLSDSLDLFEDLEVFYRQWVPGFNFVHPVPGETEAYWTIFNTRPDIFAEHAYMSCMQSEFRKPMIHKAYLKRGIPLEKSRCGMCEKCAYEYLHYVAFGVEQFDRWYFDKCVDKLQSEVHQTYPRAPR